MDAYNLRARCIVKSQPPPVFPILSSTLFIVAHQVISLLPNGHIFEAWALHPRTRAKRMDVGAHIAICRSQGELGDDEGRSRSVVTATITSIAHCDRKQVIFHMEIDGDCATSLLSMPVSCTSISYFRRLLYQLLSINQLPPPPLPTTQNSRRTSPSSPYTPEDDAY
jgi:hypothetical protein